MLNKQIINWISKYKQTLLKQPSLSCSLWVSISLSFSLYWPIFSIHSLSNRKLKKNYLFILFTIIISNQYQNVSMNWCIIVKVFSLTRCVIGNLNFCQCFNGAFLCFCCCFSVAVFLWLFSCLISFLEN